MFVLNEMFQQNASKFLIFKYLYETHVVFSFLTLSNFTFLPYECPGLGMSAKVALK